METDQITEDSVNAPWVLVVDDSYEVLKLIESYFVAAGSHVTTAATAQEAKSIISRRHSNNLPIDLIVLDIRLPDLNGNQLSRQIREIGHAGPIVAMTSGASMAGKRKSVSVGIDRYFSKEVLNKKLVMAILREYCGWSEQQ